MKYLLDTRVSYHHGIATIKTNGELQLFSKFFDHKINLNTSRRSFYYFSYHHPLPNNGHREIYGFYCLKTKKLKKIYGYLNPSSVHTQKLLPKRKLHAIELSPLKKTVLSIINSIYNLTGLLHRIDQQIYDSHINNIDHKLLTIYNNKQTFELNKEVFFENQEEHQSLFINFKYTPQQEQLSFVYREELAPNKEYTSSGQIISLKPLKVSNIQSSHIALPQNNRKQAVTSNYSKIATILQSAQLERHLNSFQNEFEQSHLCILQRQEELQKERSKLTKIRADHLNVLKETVYKTKN